jgi:hypothetical protein
MKTLFVLCHFSTLGALRWVEIGSDFNNLQLAIQYSVDEAAPYCLLAYGSLD